MLTDDELAQIEKRAKAPAGHWEYFEKDSYAAHAREDVPALLAEVRRLGGVVTSMVHIAGDAQREIRRLRAALGTIPYGAFSDSLELGNDHRDAWSDFLEAADEHVRAALDPAQAAENPAHAG